MAIPGYLYLGNYAVLPVRYHTVDGVLKAFCLWYRLLIDALYPSVTATTITITQQQ